MECACMIDYDIDSYCMPVRSRAVMVRARKELGCVECARPIGVGEMYEHLFSVWQQGWQIDRDITRTCMNCLSVRKALFCGSWIISAIWEEVWNMIVDTEGQVSSECVLALTPHAREQMLDMIDEYWERR